MKGKILAALMLAALMSAGSVAAAQENDKTPAAGQTSAAVQAENRQEVAEQEKAISKAKTTQAETSATPKNRIAPEQMEASAGQEAEQLAKETAAAVSPAVGTTSAARSDMTQADAEKPRTLRLARVPLIALSSYAGGDVREMLETQLDRALHVPLNDTLKAVEEIPQGEVEDALAQVMADLKGTKKRVKLKNAMQPLAEKLDADLVVCPVLTAYQEFIYYGGLGWGWDDGDSVYMDSYVRLELDGYDRVEQKNFSRDTSRYYRGGYTPSNEASVLAKDALNSLAQATELNRRVMRTVRERAGQ